MAMVPYLMNDNAFITYDDEESIEIKVNWAIEKGFAGLMWWEVSQDRTDRLFPLVVKMMEEQKPCAMCNVNPCT